MPSKVEGGVVDSHVRHGNFQTNTVLNRSDVGEVEHLVVQCLYLTDLLHLNVVDADRPQLVTLYASHDAQCAGQVETLRAG